jgi:hypothetical protein
VFKATGGHVQSSNDVIQLVGAFVTAVLGDQGAMLMSVLQQRTLPCPQTRSGQNRCRDRRTLARVQHQNADVVEGEPQS